MNLSMKWLADYVDVNCDIKEFVSGMTLSGSKVEGYEVEGEEISNVVVGKILEVVPHENSDHLVICQVDVGQDKPIQIVTGADNVFAGAKVPVALNGATLPDGVKIKKGKLRGVESNGMLCSLGELNLTTGDFPYAIEDGIFIIEEDCKVGEDIHSAVGINDTCVEFEITSNRPDCLSVLGLAREAHATFDVPINVKEPEFKGNNEKIEDYVSVDVQNKDLCKRYISAIVKNAKVEPSPRWMRERLRASGVRPINNFVDITNYVMLEYGHPMHAFDLKYVKGNKIVVRTAKKGESIKTLDGIDRELDESMLCICDENKPMCIAGVMGGENSGIMDDTTTVAFEAACFDGASVRITSKKLGLRSESSARNEKGLNAENCIYAMKRALQLVEMLGCGEVVGTISDNDFSDHTEKAVEFNAEWINSFLGTDIPENKQIEYLTKLGFKVENGKVIVPSYRIDIECKADVAEEVARIYGYNNIKSTALEGIAEAKLTPSQKFQRDIENTMVSVGYNEIITFSFISPKYFDKINLPQDSKLRNTVTITNPLGEDTSVMRTTTIPSMLETLARNYNFRNSSASLFELGNEYIVTGKDTLPKEPLRLTLGSYGEDVDFYSMKGVVEKLLSEINIDGYEIEAICDDKLVPEYNCFHPGRSAVITKGNTVIGYFGEVHPVVLKNYDIGVRAYVGKLNVPQMLEIVSPERLYKPLPKFPASTRDLSLICDEKLPVSHIEKAIKESCGKILESIKLFDVYQGKQIDEGKKSVSYSITLRSYTQTLTDEQADNAVSKVLKRLEKIGVSLRK